MSLGAWLDALAQTRTERERERELTVAFPRKPHTNIEANKRAGGLDAPLRPEGRRKRERERARDVSSIKAIDNSAPR